MRGHMGQQGPAGHVWVFYTNLRILTHTHDTYRYLQIITDTYRYLHIPTHTNTPYTCPKLKCWISALFNMTVSLTTLPHALNFERHLKFGNEYNKYNHTTTNYTSLHTRTYTHVPTHIYTDFLAVKTDYLSFSKLRYDSQHGKAFFNSGHDGDSRAATFCCHINKKLFCNFQYSLSHKMPQFGQIRWYMRPNDCVGYVGAHLLGDGNKKAETAIWIAEEFYSIFQKLLIWAVSFVVLVR